MGNIRKDVPKNNCTNISTAIGNSKIAGILEKYNYSALSKVDNLEFEGIIKETMARKIALELDLVSNAELVKLIKEYGVYAFKDEMDLIELKGKSAELIKNVQFYKSELDKVQNEFIDCQDELRKRELIDQMDFFEKQVDRYNSAYNKIKELTNKVRYSIQKRKQWEEERKAKQAESGLNIIDLSDVDFDKLEDE